MPNQQHAMRELEPHSMSIHQIIQQGASGLQSMPVIGTVYVCLHVGVAVPMEPCDSDLVA